MQTTSNSVKQAPSRLRVAVWALAAAGVSAALVWTTGYAVSGAWSAVQRGLDPADVLTRLAAVGAVAVLAWLALGTTVALVSAWPSRRGGRSRGTRGAGVRASRLVTPMSRRIAAVLLGAQLGVLATPAAVVTTGAGLVAVAATSARAEEPAPGPGFVPQAPVPGPGWSAPASPASTTTPSMASPTPQPGPTSPAPPRPSAAASATTPAPSATGIAPTGSPASTTPPVRTSPAPTWTPSAPRVRPVLSPALPPAATPRVPTDEPRTVAVRRGDCLWTIVERHLGPGARITDIAREWPRWYAANRAVIGDDPDLLHAGQVLVVPADASTGAVR